MNVVVTGATGFIGRRLSELISGNAEIITTAVVRRAVDLTVDRLIEVGDITNKSDWASILENQDVLVHCAARAHVMQDIEKDPLAAYRRTNVSVTLELARQAAVAGVKRFVFISSIKVNGEQTPLGRPFTGDDTPAPIDAYGISKWEAEQGLRRIASETGMEVVIIRPPLVYGPNVRGNFASMMKLVAKGIPLPLGAIHNQRSLVALDNLVDLVFTCIEHPAAANQMFLAGDGQDVSTTELLRSIARAMGKPARLIPLHSSLLMLGATLVGKRSFAQRLLGSLQVDISQTRNSLGWEPPISVEEGLRRCFAENRFDVTSV